MEALEALAGQVLELSKLLHETTRELKATNEALKTTMEQVVALKYRVEILEEQG